MAEGLAEAGASLMLCARREEWLTPTVAAMRKQGFKVEGALCDVAKASDVQAVVDKTIAAYGRVDILINNAGVTWAAEPEDMPLDKWQKVIDINLTGAFLFAQAAGRDMLTRQWGRIINIASIAGMHASVHGPHYAGYAASKAGLMGLTRELAASWARQGIRVNAIAPGFFHSRLADGAIAMNEASIKALEPDPARRRRRRAEGRRRVPRRRRVQLHHRPDHRRRRRTHNRVTPASPYAARPWLRHYDYWVRPHLSYPGRPLARHPRHRGDRAAGSPGDAVSRRAADLPRAEAARRRARRRARAPRHRQGRSRRHHAAQLPAVHHRRVRGAAARRDRRQHQPELHRARGADGRDRLGRARW